MYNRLNHKSINLLLPHVVFTGITTRNFESTNSSSVKLLHTNSLICDFEISTQRFRTATMVDWMQQLCFMIRSVVYTRSLVVAPKMYEKSPNLCIEYCPLECAKTCSTVCIYMCLRSIKSKCNLQQSNFLISWVFSCFELHLSCFKYYFNTKQLDKLSSKDYFHSWLPT